MTMTPMTTMPTASIDLSGRDRSVWPLLLANAALLGVALWQRWPLNALMVPYWIQSLVIGWYARRRILALGRFSTEGFTVNGRTVAPTEETKRSTANFFALHYGGFHAGYLLFLLAFSAEAFGASGGSRFGGVDWLLAIATALPFVWTHRDSHRRHVAADLAGLPNIGALMFLPYLRILPMHLTIIIGAALTAGGASALATLLFVALKTGADLGMHWAEHFMLRRRAEKLVRAASGNERAAVKTAPEAARKAS